MKKLIFEPWALGDSLIAASALLVQPDLYTLACQGKWHTLIKSALGNESVDLLDVSLAYTQKHSARNMKILSRPPQEQCDSFDEVYNIRGDLRDNWAARKIFSNAHISTTGYWPFVARRFGPFDLIQTHFIKKIRNRYQAWSEILGISFNDLLSAYEANQLINQTSPANQKVVIHIGAQWRSRQYPYVLSLSEKLESLGFVTTVVGGPHDIAPPQISEEKILRLEGPSLVEEFKSAQFVIANDSSPMHLAALVGKPVLAIALISNIYEWLPPTATPVCADTMPSGYRPHFAYQSDEQINNWPHPSKVIEAAAAHKSLRGFF